jgi:hypothetical protein
MPQKKFQFNLKGGGTLDFEGDNPPTDEQVEAAAKENKVELMPADAAPPTDTKAAPPPPAAPVAPPPKPPVDTRGTLRKVWDAANKPLTTLPSEVAGKVADSIDSPSLDRSPFAAQVEGFAGGVTQGIGDLMSGFTSPINLAGMLASGGSSMAAKAGLPTIAKGLTAAGNLANAAQIPSGAMKVINPNSTWGERGQGLVEIAMGASGLSDAPKVPERIDPNIEFGVKPPNAKPTGMGAAIPPVSPEVAGATRVGKSSTTAANTINAENAAKTAAQAAKDANFVDPHAKYRAAPMGTEFTLKPGEINRKKMDDFIALGYNYKDMDARGNIIIEKVKESPAVKEYTAPEYKTNKLMEALNAPRTLMASMDFSAPLRQGVGLIHKKEFWSSLDDMFKAWGSEGAYNAIMEDITKEPMFKKNIDAKGNIKPSMAEEAGLKFTDLNSMSAREEAFKSSWAEKVPGVRRSNRAYTAFLNKLRADTFKSLIEDSKVIGQDGKVNKPLANAFAEFVNTSTGRGSLGKLEPASNILATALFSPRLIASRIQMLNPQYYWALPAPARKEALKSLFAIAGLGATVTTLGKMAGGKVETDPSSSDFGKIQLGQTRLDPYAGFQQYIVAAERLMPALDKLGIKFGGRFKSTNTQRKYSLSNPGYGQSEPADVAERFAVGKANPVLGFAWQLMMRNQRELSGEKMNFKTMNPMENSLAQRFIPLLMQDMYDLINEEGLQPKDAVIAPLATLGMGVQEYKKQRPH